MSHLLHLQQQISPLSDSATFQDWETNSANKIDQNLNLFSSTNVFTEEKEDNHQSNGKSLSQISQRSTESTHSSCSMEIDREDHIRCRRPTYLAIFKANYFPYHQVHQQERQIKEERMINNVRSNTHGNRVIFLETPGIQTEMDFDEQQPLLDERHDDKEEEDKDHDHVNEVEEEFLHTNPSQNGSFTPFHRF